MLYLTKMGSLTDCRDVTHTLEVLTIAQPEGVLIQQQILFLPSGRNPSRGITR